MQSSQSVRPGQGPPDRGPTKRSDNGKSRRPLAVTREPLLLPQQQLIFLLSAPRSGSTILAHTLSNTKLIHSASEPWLVLALEQLGRVHLRSEYGSWHVAKAVGDFLGPDRTSLLARMAQLVYASKLPPESSFFLDKTPRYFWVYDFLFELFPAAKFIVLRRNPLDIAASFKTTWGLDLRGDVLAKNSELMLFDLFHSIARVRRIRPDSERTVCEVEYESFVQHPANEISRILRELGVHREVPDNVGQVDRQRIDPQHFGDQKILETTAVHQNSVGYWRRALEREEAELVAAYFGLQVPGLQWTRSETAQRRAQQLVRRLQERLEARRSDTDASVEPVINNPEIEHKIRLAYRGIFAS
jgi:hypothetical protein